VSKHILVVLHRGATRTGRFGDKLQARGYELDVCCPVDGDALPADLQRFSGIVMFGGPMGANDEAQVPGLRAELEWIPQVLRADTPFCGICLGAQLLARVLGARVHPHPKGLVEVGYYPINPCGDALLAQPLEVFQWHRDGFELPAGAERLAAGDTFPNQAFRYARATYGLQFHPEITAEIIEDWASRVTDTLHQPGARPSDTLLADHDRCAAATERWLDGFLDCWLESR
jgi:GMP synthase (glutamine-hydrolysing)